MYSTICYVDIPLRFFLLVLIKGADPVHVGSVVALFSKGCGVVENGYYVPTWLPRLLLEGCSWFNSRHSAQGEGLFAELVRYR
jgi:hypothetical protein